MDIAIRMDRFEDAAVVRRAVFMDEQGYESEFDAIDDDARCLHIALYADGGLAGCARVFPEPLERALSLESPQSPSWGPSDALAPDEVYLLGRVAVLPALRRRGLASLIVDACDEAARKAGARAVKLHAQEYIQPLYAAHGYAAISDVDYEDEGQPHIWMAKKL